MRKEDGFEGQQTYTIPDFIIKKIKKEPISSNLFITHIGYYPNALNHYRLRPQGSPQYILIYCIKGNGWISINSKKIIVCENHYFIIPENTPHSYASSKQNPWTIYWIHFSGKSASVFANKDDCAQSINPSSIDRIEERLQLFEEIISNLKMGYTIDNVNYANICLLHFLASFQYLSQYRQVRKTNKNDIIENSMIYMKNHLYIRLTLEDLAKQAQLSVSHYSLLFRKKTGQAPLSYLIQLKIQLACQLLDHTKLSISKVANKVGYDDPYYFSRIFRKTMGESPKTYRQNLKG